MNNTPPSTVSTFFVNGYVLVHDEEYIFNKPNADWTIRGQFKTRKEAKKFLKDQVKRWTTARKRPVFVEIREEKQIKTGYVEYLPS